MLRRAWYSLNQAFRRRIAHLELTPDQYTVLRTLSEAPPGSLAQRDLCRLMSSDPNTVASLVERMETAGLIERHADPEDRRARRVQLTATGQGRFEGALDVAVGLQAEVLSSWDAPARQEFLARLERVADACRAAAERSPRSTDGTEIPA